MEIGLIFALLSALTFAPGNNFIRRGTFQAGEAFTASLLSVFVGMPIFSLAVFLAADWDKLWSLSWQGYALLGTAGITHFVLGRLLIYKCFRLIGANKGSALARTQMVYAVILGIVLFQEPLTFFLVLGVLGIIAGVTLVSLEKGGEAAKIYSKGIIAGLGGGLLWGTSGVLIKAALDEIGSPYAAALVSNIAASLVMAGFLFGKAQREQLTNLSRQSLIFLVAGGIFSVIAQLFRYLALNYSPLSIVEPLIGTAVLFTFFLSFFLNRKIEVFTWKVFTGIVVTVVGTFLLFK